MARNRKDDLEQAIKEALAPGAFIGYRDNGNFVEDVAHRVSCGERRTHEGVITTDAPNVMWGTDGARVLTVDDGYVWLFAAVEHWNFECMGFYVCKYGDRFAALEPVAQGVKRVFGSIEAGTARGLSLRMDHGTQYLSDHFINQLRFWGVTPSFAFVGEPQTNGVAERFLGIVREQVAGEATAPNLIVGDDSRPGLFPDEPYFFFPDSAARWTVSVNSVLGPASVVASGPVPGYALLPRTIMARSSGGGAPT